MTHDRSYRGILWSLALLGATLDQVSKYGVFRWLYDAERREGEYHVVPGAFRLLAQFTPDKESGTSLRTTLRTWSGELIPKVNHGALFGFGGKFKELANTLFAVVSVLAAFAIIYWSGRRSTARDLPLCIALGLILAGTLGNLYDRLVFQGVRDFLHFYWFEWPVFNVADCCLVCGAGFLLIQAFFVQPSSAQEDPAGATVAAATDRI